MEEKRRESLFFKDEQSFASNLPDSRENYNKNESVLVEIGKSNDLNDSSFSLSRSLSLSSNPLFRIMVETKLINRREFNEEGY